MILQSGTVQTFPGAYPKRVSFAASKKVQFEPPESAYVLILEHPSKQHPSCWYQFKDNLAAYLQIHTDPESVNKTLASPMSGIGSLFKGAQKFSVCPQSTDSRTLLDAFGPSYLFWYLTVF